jgi:hypothetical protein
MSDDTEKDEISIGTSLIAAVKVALSNTAHAVFHPIHATKALLGFEEEKTIPEMIRDEEKRMSERKKERQLSHG